MKKDKKGFITEFKEFIMRGNVIDMAIGVVVATAFGKITTSLVNDIIMPFIGWIIGDINLANLKIVLVQGVENSSGVLEGEVAIAIGALIVTIIDFIIIAFIVFLIVKLIAKMRAIAEARKKKEEESAPAEDPKPTTEELLAEILEEIKKK